jgi:hypothetical protein
VNQEQESFVAGIVGGGKGGSEILRLFGRSELLKVSFVCDLNDRAPAMVAARNSGIQTWNSLEDAMRSHVDFLFEATGSKKVLQALREKAPEGVHIIEHETALFFFRVLSDVTSSTHSGVIQDIRHIREGITASASRINQQMRAIYSITNGLHVIGLNARVEAARIGEQGAGFDVVAQEVQKSAQKVRAISDEITNVSSSIVSLSATVDSSLAKLSTTDPGGGSEASQAHGQGTA